MTYADYAAGEPREYPDPLDVSEPAAVEAERVTYFATVSKLRRRAEPMVPSGEIESREATISPSVAAMHHLSDWLAEHAGRGDDVTIVRRTVTAHGSRDEVVVDVSPDPDHERLAGLVRGTRDVLAGAVPRRPPRVGDRAAPASTAVTEGEGAREQVMARVEATRYQRANERPLRGGDASAPMLAYDDVYTANGDPRPEYADDVQRWRDHARTAGRGS